MAKLPVVMPRKLISALRRQGFFIDRQRGSHAVLRHKDGRMTIVPIHPRDIPTGTLKGILDDINITIDELKDLL